MSDFAKGRAAQRQTIKDQAAEITRLRAELATARREGMEEAAKRLEELHKNHNYDHESGDLIRKPGRYDRWPEAAKTAKLEHDAGYYRAIAEGVAHIRAALATARREGMEEAAQSLIEKYQSMVIRPNTPEAWRISILQDLQEMAGEKPNIITAVDIDAAIHAASGEVK